MKGAFKMNVLHDSEKNSLSLNLLCDNSKLLWAQYKMYIASASLVMWQFENKTNKTNDMMIYKVNFS